MSDERVQPFANGHEYLCWLAANCERCTKFDPTHANDCDLEYALALACVLDGTIAPEIVTRLGYSREKAVTLGWPCQERELATPPRAGAASSTTEGQA